MTEPCAFVLRRVDVMFDIARLVVVACCVVKLPLDEIVVVAVPPKKA